MSLTNLIGESEAQLAIVIPHPKPNCHHVAVKQDDCKTILLRLGYDNTNCIGCVKGGKGYFRAIRQDFPEEFEALCAPQDERGEGSYRFRDRARNVRFSPRDLGDGLERRSERLPVCSFFCEMAEAELTSTGTPHS